MAINEQETRPVVWGVSAFQLAEHLRNVSAEFTGQLRLEVIDSHFDDALMQVRARMRHERCDAIISAGTNAEYLAARLPLPVISVRVGGDDVMSALVKARAISSRIAVVLHRAVTPGLEEFAQHFELALEFRRYDTSQEAGQVITELAQKGIRVIVGAGVAVHMAEKVGLAGVFIYATDSVRTAFAEVLRVVQAGSAQRSRSSLLTAVLHHLSDGVVAIDREGRVIAANPAAEALTRSQLNAAIGEPLRATVPTLGAGRALTHAEAEAGVVEELFGRTLVVDRAPLMEAGAHIGAVLTLHQPSYVERAFSSLQAHDYKRSRLAKYSLDDIVASSPAMRAVIKRCRVLAENSEATVLVTGPSGVGKELIAQGIHSASARAKRPFVAVNCGAFPETLLESELFGYEEGAFTGARRNGKAGLFETAHRGTIFLDEIAELPLLLQTRLLRVLQEREITRVGGSETIPVNLRVIAATHRNLRELTRQGLFREDLFYRISVLRVEVPNLKDRPEDLEVLTDRFLDRSLGRVNLRGLSARLRAVLGPILQRHDWPGNVRELENVCERIAMACLEKGAAISKVDAQLLLDEAVSGGQATSLPSVQRGNEIAHIKQILARCGGNQAAAAKMLGVSRTTLWRKLHGVQAKD